MPGSRALCLVWGCCLVLGVLARPGSAQRYDGVLGDPVVLGGWLYRAKCQRCHVDYGQERLAAGYDSERELVRAIGETGCRISWSRRAGGELGERELQALAAFMQRWEEADGPPDLPELPPLPREERVVGGEEEERKEPVLVPEPTPGELTPPLERLIERSRIAQGGYLYTRNCYRCHLSYEKARMGKGLTPETVHRFISGGKTSTQMKPFSRVLGGNLKNSEISAIVFYIEAWERAGEPLAIAEILMQPPALDPTDLRPLILPRFRPLSGDPSTGAGIYRRRCSRCHGEEGEGYIGRALAEEKGVYRTDLFLKSVVKQGVPGSLMPAWDIGAGGSLAAREIDDVVVYIDGLGQVPHREGGR